MRPLLLALPLAVLVAAPAAAQEPTGGAKVYQQAVPAVTWIQSTRPNGLASGSGTLVDADRRLVLTNYHVVEDNPQVTIMFPEFRDGQPVPERQFYQDRAKRFGVPGRVVAVDPKSDLAVVQIDRVPDGVKAVALAADSPTPGETVHSIGNAGKSGALFGYVRGTVRQVYRKKWQAALDKNKVATFEAKVIETDSPTNPGDSGGPLLNDAGRLVGVTQGGATNAASVSFFVDLSQVKQVMDSPKVKAAGGKGAVATADKPPAEPKAAPEVKDEAALFGPTAVAEANELLAALSKAGREVRVETLASAPAEWIDKAKKASPADRQKLFSDYARERLKAEKSDGSMIVVCLDPRVVTVHESDRAKKTYPPGTAKKVGDAMIAALKDKKYDDGLLAALKAFRDAEKPK